MNTYNVFQHPTNGFEAVKNGFSFPAFLLGWIWAFSKKLWGVGFLSLASIIFLAMVNTDGQGSPLTVVSGILLIGIWFLFGFKGNQWRSNQLTNRGYELLDTVPAKTKDAAIAEIAKRSEQTG